MTLQPADLDRLEQLAREATPGPWRTFYDNYEDGTMLVGTVAEGADNIVGDDIKPADAAAIAALSPDVVSELVAAARLGAAWQAAEAALPEGMSLAGVRERRPLAESERWEASAKSTFKVANPRGALYGYGPTPAAALLALAEVLRERP